jgi:MarR family transcriptional regulator, organic hydroperoxide resistance regulator
MSSNLANRIRKQLVNNGHELAMLLRKAYLSFHRRANARILSCGITVDQYVVLTVIAREPGMTQVTIVARTESDENTVAAILRRLEQQRLIRREVHARDGRERCVFLTAAGRRLHKRAAEAGKPILANLLSCVSNRDRRAVQRCLKAIHEVFSYSKMSINGKPRPRS